VARQVGRSFLTLQLFEQGFRILEIWELGVLGEPAINRCQRVSGFRISALTVPGPREACGSAQFPEFSTLFLCSTYRLYEANLYLGWIGLGSRQ